MVWVLFAFMPMANFGERTLAKDIPKPPLWIVDGDALKDSSFQYSIPEMRFDSAAMPVERSLSYVSVSDIKSIDIYHSTKYSGIIINHLSPLSGKRHKGRRNDFSVHFLCALGSRNLTVFVKLLVSFLRST